MLMSKQRMDESIRQVTAARELILSLIVNTNVGWVLTAAGVTMRRSRSSDKRFRSTPPISRHDGVSLGAWPSQVGTTRRSPKLIAASAMSDSSGTGTFPGIIEASAGRRSEAVASSISCSSDRATNTSRSFDRAHLQGAGRKRIARSCGWKRLLPRAPTPSPTCVRITSTRNWPGTHDIRASTCAR